MEWRTQRDRLLAEGWKPSGGGDWAWVYRSPDGGRAARLAPFDPAFRGFVGVCIDLAGNPHVPVIDEVLELGACGTLVTMEWLDLIPTDGGRLFLGRLW